LQPQIQTMDYNRIVAVTGLPGLYEVLSSKADGAIVRSLEDQSTKFVASRVHNLSHLESIEVYTTRDNVTLADVFNSMREKKEALPDVKENKALQDYFKKVYPDMDFDRVYASDMKKMVKWFEVLEANQVDYNAKPEEQEAEEEPVEVEAEVEAPKKAKAKKEEPVAEKAPVEKTAEKKAPAKASKKAAPKAEAKQTAPKKAAAKKKK
jgi:outer membrane biosynthesis protein TonB